MLVSEDDYVQLTGDEDTASVLVTGALLESQQMLEEELRRPLELAEYTESLPVMRNGRAYPSATPLVSTPNSAAYFVADAGSIYFGWGNDPVINWNGAEWYGIDASGWMTPIIEPDMPSPVITFTYTGGFDATSLPPVLRRAIIRLAAALLRERDPNQRKLVNQLPQGVTTLTVGDVSITRVLDDKEIDLLVPGLTKSVKKYRKLEP